MSRKLNVRYSAQNHIRPMMLNVAEVAIDAKEEEERLLEATSTW